mmetsp:Transcript_32856/g.49573  ORF Transcript_32856/g.49573 Transcript_32856/m.49573 type:complete len:443 (+) Transcript_32856:324-1652(+)|eukprot:CAMPEP_0178934028 /NCGR_PEP_ID=MMETSP0786-20121207/23637_1 /TAXON_ID=186022 /ORGANISM="Thalassionema frauenfeldii, Strain CCMP 1798" /LENGTH=442 /DNA_ID=CAMNT_0020611769 /DNA_START=312 /DNA_END=1640 /DNA_ORIENTATION=+
MDVSTLTHVAAIVVGMVLTLVVVKSLQVKDAGPLKTAANATKSTARKRKKKKSKSSNGSSQGAKGKEEAVIEDRSLPTPSSVEDDPKSAKGKPKNKKKKNDGKSKQEATPILHKEAASSNQAETAVPKTQTIFPEENKEKANPQWETHKPDEEWVVEGPKKKKKNRSQKPKVANSAQTPSPVASTDSITVSATKVGVVIGPKGATMKALEEATGCKMDINAPSKEDSSKLRKPLNATIVITGGDAEGIAKAKAAIMELTNKGYAKLLQSDNFGEFSTMVHPRHLSEIVGPGGKTIQAIQSALDVKLTIPSTDWKPNTPQVGQVKLCKVGIAGSKEKCKEAKTVIQSLLRWHHHEITHPGLVHEQINVPQEFYHCVIGTKGSEIKHIRGNFKVEMYMPNEDSVTDDIIIVGKQMNVDRAITYIQRLIDRDTEQRERRYHDEFY